jgi:hypothetical protein
LSYPIDPPLQKYKNILFLSYQAPLVCNHKGFLGVITPSLVDTKIMSMKYLASTPFPLGVDASFDLVVSHHVQPMVMSMQSLTDTSPMFMGDASLNLFVLHLVQPMVVSMQSSTENTLVFWGDAPLYHVISHSTQPMVE